MKNEDGNLYYGTGVDTSGFEEGMEYIEERASKAADNIAFDSQRINELLKFPEAKIDISLVNAENIDSIGDSVQSVISENKKGIQELQAEYDKLSHAMGEAYMQGNDEEYFRLKQQADAVKSVISARKKAIKEAEKLGDELDEVYSKIQKEQEAQKKANKQTEDATQKKTSLRGQIKALKEEMANLVAQGIDEESDAYKKLINELGRLTDIQNDIANQGKVLANDEAQIAGVIQGLSGLSGAFTAAQGAVSLFSGENEELQKIMLKVQSLMAITMGLQQIQQTLNKDSAFSLVTLNSLKTLWNKITGQSATETKKETAAIEENTIAKEENANAGEDVADAEAQESVATDKETASEVKNASAKKTATTAAIAESGAVKGGTASKVINTAVTWASTAATYAWATALKVLKYALISTGIGALVVLVGELISWIVELCDTTDEASKSVEENNELMKESRKVYAEESMALDNNIRKLKTFNGTKEQEQKLIKDLNSKYGETLGYHKSRAEWLDVLQTKGKAYCEVMMLEAKAQAILNKYTEAYINLLEVKDKAEAGEYDHWYQTKAGDRESRRKAIQEAQDDVDKWEREYKQLQTQIDVFKSENDLNFHADPEAVSIKGKGGSNFDPKKAAVEYQKSINTWNEARKKYLKTANDEYNKAFIDGMADGLTKERNLINQQTQQRLEAWEQSMDDLAKALQQAEHDKFMSKKDATEYDWLHSEQGKRSLAEWRTILMQDASIYEAYTKQKEQIRANGNAQLTALNQSYTDALIDQFGTTQEKEDKLYREWMKKLSFMPAEYLGKATEAMEAEFAKLKSEDFKKAIDWDSVFGDLGKQATESIRINLERIKAYFDANKNSMDAKEIKEYTDAIKNMENEIASRNPFEAMHKSLKEIGEAKEELKTALGEMKTAHDELTEAIRQRNQAQQEYNDILTQIEEGTLVEGCEQQTQAYEKLTSAQNAVTQAREKDNNATNRVVKLQNKIKAGYVGFAQSLKSIGGVISDVGGKAKNFAALFKSDVAKSIGKALDFTEEVLDATDTVINAIGDLGKNVASGVESAVTASAQGSTAAATAGATAMSTIEKASAILAVISAALQIATAIANLFNDDESKQEEIERLQERIDQLQWELDNQDAVRLQNSVGDAVARLRDIYAKTTEEVERLHLNSEQYGNYWLRYIARAKYQNEIYEKTIEKIADAYAAVSYTADKALGNQMFQDSRKQLEKMAEQQILIQQQIQNERDKKDTDNGKIAEWENDIRELAEQMATLINDMLEDIIGYSAKDLASELGNAFFEAAAQGEDAMEAWHKKVNDIVADITKRMLITKFLEEPMGEIFNKYKQKWFGENGQFKGIDTVLDSMTGFSNDLNALSTNFKAMWDALPQNVQDMLTADAERSGESKGIATASQDSVDENNARLTTIQGHTYSIVQGVTELNSTSNQMLQRLTGIENNTAQANTKLDGITSRVRNIEDTIDDIYRQGIKLKS